MKQDRDFQRAEKLSVRLRDDFGARMERNNYFAGDWIAGPIAYSVSLIHKYARLKRSDRHRESFVYISKI